MQIENSNAGSNRRTETQKAKKEDIKIFGHMGKVEKQKGKVSSLV